ncbi:MAG TPA: FAD-binding oxidoreductase [Pseudomonadales bacterium]
MSYRSWGGYPYGRQQGICLASRDSDWPQSGQTLLPYGLGRSYGDSCQNVAGQVLSSRQLRHFIAFDADSGRLDCEAGVTLADIIRVCLPQGWFLPVTPGTKHVTVGGAIANDVHGKNHHVAGSFSHHLYGFELLRSDGSRLFCSDSENREWYQATVGGLGLTGFITRASLQLRRVDSSMIDCESIRYQHLGEFFSLSAESADSHEYTVAWIDCLAGGSRLGRGHFIRGNHAAAGSLALADEQHKLSIPFTPPLSLVNRLTLKPFNTLYYHRQRQQRVQDQRHYDPFFYPLDGILNWNRIYGSRGFVQYQCLIPLANAQAGIRDMLHCISKAGLGSFLVVLKMMGDLPSKGVLSFAGEGATLAMDFPMQGQKTLDFLLRLDDIVRAAGGRLYPAKDARMPAAMFQAGYPQWHKLEAMRDPAINSGFWQRVTGKNGE